MCRRGDGGVVVLILAELGFYLGLGSNGGRNGSLVYPDNVVFDFRFVCFC